MGFLIFPVFASDELAARRSNGNELVSLRFPTFSAGRGPAPQRRRETGCREKGFADTGTAFMIGDVLKQLVL